MLRLSLISMALLCAGLSALGVLGCKIGPPGVASSASGSLSVLIEFAAGPQPLERTASRTAAATPGAPRTLLPAVDMVPASFAVSCFGPGGTVIEATIGDPVTRFGELVPGEWRVTVTAANAAGIAIAEGTADVAVKPAVESSVTVTVAPLGGEGSLQITVRWTAVLADDPSIDSQITSPSEVTVPLAFSVDGTTASASQDGLEAGYHTLQVRLFDGGEVVAGKSEIVRIVAGQTTSGELDFSGFEGSPGSLDARFLVDLKDPIAVEIAGKQDRIGIGQTLFLKTWPQAMDEAIESDWYIDGAYVNRQPSISAGSDLELGVHCVDLIVRDPSRRRAGSASFLVEVLPSLVPGSLAHSGRFVDGESGVDGLRGSRSVVVAPDGQSLYAAGYEDSAIAWFTRDGETGMLRFAGAYADGDKGIAGLEGVEALALSPDGVYLVAGGSSDGTLVVFRREATNGALGFLYSCSSSEPGFQGLAGVRSLCFSPDGTSLYAAGRTAGAVVCLRFDPATGEVSPVQTLADESDGLTLLGGATSLTVSPDGSQVFAAAYDDDSLLVFDRDEATGALTLVQSFTDGMDGCEGLSGASRVVVGGDGLTVYVAGYYDNALSLFSRSEPGGPLSFQRVFKDGIEGVEGLRYAQDIAIAADGSSVYVAASYGDDVACFQRSSETGELGFLESIGGMDGARGVVLSADGRNCYVTASGENALYLLNRRQ